MCRDEADGTGWLIFELYPFKSYLSKLGQVKQQPHATGIQWQLVLNCLNSVPKDRNIQVDDFPV